MKLEFIADDETIAKRLEHFKYPFSIYSVLACEDVKLFLYQMGKLFDLMELREDGSYLLPWPHELVDAAAMSIIKLDAHQHGGFPMLIPGMQLIAHSVVAEVMFTMVLSIALSGPRLGSNSFAGENLQESSWLFEHRWQESKYIWNHSDPPGPGPFSALQLLSGEKKKKKERPCRGACKDYPMVKSRG